MFAEAFEKRSSAFFANGITFNKFTGSRGKSGSNDANAEYIAALRKAMDDAGVAYQFAELGRDVYKRQCGRSLKRRMECSMDESAKPKNIKMCIRDSPFKLH